MKKVGGKRGGKSLGGNESKRKIQWRAWGLGKERTSNTRL